MAPQDTIFLCLVFCLGQRIQAQEEFPIPAISASPSSVIPWNGSVRILCRGTPESFQYQLFTIENSTFKVVQTQMGFQKAAEFIINHMNTTTAGCYQCRYRKKYSWSEQSQTLELVVTGLHDKPVLSTDQSLVLMPGESISFRCHSAHVPFDRFSLAKEGEALLPQHQHGEHHSKFTLGPVTPDSTGNYSCYGWNSSSPYVWSAPSDALELLVAATDMDSKKQGYRMENSIRMAMAGLILVVLLVILAENWHSQEASHHEDWHNLDAQSQNKQEHPT
ncbi:immunoglobulin alpha Fc receptor [Nannospalax galili]|uniref:immunoglobulin alpha Fc receptor n=1 Tax=Nannospalax galili TaxID=1026970 RepID=UPI000819CC73|nr:immunoglobulin alpha Fc receptor [Nannospalax galili]